MSDIADMSDAELDRAVAREVMGWIPGSRNTRWHDAATDERGIHKFMRNFAAWSPSTDIATAMNDVVSEMRRRGYRFMVSDAPDSSDCGCGFYRGVNSFFEQCAFGREARAICEAALAAVRGA